MEHNEIERWARQVINSIAVKHRIEDDRVEAKRVWPSPNKSARRIAGLVNAARGGPSLWMIGLDDKTGEIIPPTEDPAQSWDKIKGEFEGQPPGYSFLIVAGVYVYCFEPRLPVYVVRNEVYGSDPDKVQFEVPWREGTAVRTARQADLLRLLAPPARTPEIEIHDARLRARVTQDPQLVTLHALATLFVIAVDDVAIPYRRCECSIALDGKPLDVPFVRISCEPESGPPSATMQVTANDLACRPPGGHARLRVISSARRDAVWDAHTVAMNLAFAVVPGNAMVRTTLSLPSLPFKGSDWRDWGSPNAPTP